MKSRVTITLDPDVHARAKQVARARRTTVSGLIESFLRLSAAAPVDRAGGSLVDEMLGSAELRDVPPGTDLLFDEEKCVEDEVLQAETRSLATRLANGPTVAYATMRKNILTALENSFAEALLAEAEGQRIAGSSADAAEGGAAFMQKRKPVFKGA